MRKNRRVKQLSRAKRICERLVKKYKSSFAIIQDEVGQFIITTKNHYRMAYKSYCDKKDSFINLIKIQDYYNFKVSKNDIKKAEEIRNGN